MIISMGMEVGGKQKVSPVPRKNPCLQQCTDLLMLQEEVCSFLQRKVGKKWSYTHAPTPGPHPSIIFCKTPCKVQRQMYSSVTIHTLSCHLGRSKNILMVLYSVLHCCRLCRIYQRMTMAISTENCRCIVDLVFI